MSRWREVARRLKEREGVEDDRDIRDNSRASGAFVPNVPIVPHSLCRSAHATAFVDPAGRSATPDADPSSPPSGLDFPRPGGDGWSGEDWRAFFDERAHAARHVGGLPHDQAEACAFACCISEWLDRNPMHTAPGRCHGCGEAEHGNDLLLPFGTEPTRHAWLHSRCWPAWHASRKAEAVAAFSTFEIHATRTSP